MKLPELPIGFTAKFMSELLGRRCNSVTVDRVGDGTGMMAEMSRLTMEMEGEPEPLSLIAKYCSQNPTNRDIAVSFNLYEREARYYAELDSQTDICTPDIYFVDVDGENMLILMQDLSEYEVGSQEVGATLPQTEVAVNQLAKLHGRFWNRVDDLDWVPGIADSYHAKNMYNLGLAGWDVMVESFGVTDQVNPYKEAFIEALPNLQTEQYMSPRTLLHGDFRMENLLYGTRTEQEDVVVIDFQGPLLGSGFVDLALFLAQSTKIEVRRQHEKELVARYLEGLKAEGVSVGDEEAAWLAYRRAILYNWVYAAVVAGTLDRSNETTFAWMQQMVNRQLAASLDLDIFDLL